MACQCLDFLFRKTRLHNVDLAGKFSLRQGLWIEDLRNPPGQECSNGSLILLAVVLWRTFFRIGRDPRLMETACPQAVNAAIHGPRAGRPSPWGAIHGPRAGRLHG